MYNLRGRRLADAATGRVKDPSRGAKGGIPIAPSACTPSSRPETRFDHALQQEPCAPTTEPLRLSILPAGIVCALSPSRPRTRRLGEAIRSHHGDSVDDALFREHAEALFGDAPDGITIQHAGRIVYANPRMAALTGHGDPARLIGVSSLHLYSEEDLGLVLARLQSTFFGRPTAPVQHRILRSDGEQIEVEVSCLLLTLASTRMLVEVVRTRASRARPAKAPHRARRA